MVDADDLDSAARLATAAGTRHWQTHDPTDFVLAAPCSGGSEPPRRRLLVSVLLVTIGLAGGLLSDVAGLVLCGALLVTVLCFAYAFERAHAVRRAGTPSSRSSTPSSPATPPICISFAADPRAASLARFAFHTADEIRRTPTWQSDDLDLHRARLDLHEEVRQIARRAETVARARHALPPVASLPMTAVTEPIWQQHALLDGSLDSLHKRVAALVAYRTSLLAYDAERRLLAQIEQAEQVDLSEAVLGAAADDVAGANLAELSAELREAREAVRSTLSTLARISDPLSEIERD